MPIDGAKREASTDPKVHRDLVEVHPPLTGRDVANVNRAVHERLKARGLADDVTSPMHDQWTHAAAIAAVEACYWLGLRSATYLAKTKIRGEDRFVLGQGAQTILRDPGKRDATQLKRASDRAALLKRGPRYWNDLAARHGVGGKSMEDALTWALSVVGTHEIPAGSNRGPKIDDWIRLAGYEGPVPWCGCFVNAVVMHGGVPSGRGWIGYTPAIIQHAQNGTGGWKWVGPSQGQRGMVPVFDTPGGAAAVHTGVCLERLSASTYKTVEGNTSNGDGSQSDGGIVAVRSRSTGGDFHIVGFAIPPWPA
jgi:hypothetical protein